MSLGEKSIPFWNKGVYGTIVYYGIYYILVQFDESVHWNACEMDSNSNIFIVAPIVFTYKFT